MSWGVCVLVAQSCLTLCDPVDCSPPGSSVHGILQARILEQVAISFPRGSNLGFLHCKQILYHLSHQGNPRKVFSGRNKIIQVENSNLHKERKITEEMGKGEIKLSSFFLVDLIDNNLFKVTISTMHLIRYNYATSVKEPGCQCRWT